MTSLADEPESWPVVATETAYDGSLLGVRRDTLEHAGKTFDRERILHPGAVAVVAIDDHDQVLTLRQYRHAAQLAMVEIPAGLLDVAGEEPLAAAKRELLEEGLLVADRWRPLLQMRPSPGASTELIHIFLAEGLHPADPPDGFVAEHEEATMTREWAALDDLVEAALAGSVTNGLTIAGSLAVWRLRHGNRNDQG